jgi:hypothetical protein
LKQKYHCRNKSDSSKATWPLRRRIIVSQAIMVAFSTLKPLDMIRLVIRASI